MLPGDVAVSIWLWSIILLKKNTDKWWNQQQGQKETKKEENGGNGEIVNGKKEYSLKSGEGAIEPTSGSASACLPGCFVVWARHCVSWGTQKYTNPTEGAFLAGLGPPTHGSLFKPPPILYSSVRGGLLTQPNSTHTTKPGPQSYGGGRTRTHAHTNSYTAIVYIQTRMRALTWTLGVFEGSWLDVIGRDNNLS